MKRKTVESKKRTRRTRGNFAVTMLIIMVLVYSVVMVYFRSSINALDTEIRQLKEEYSALVKINDDLQGRIIEAHNLNEIEEYAVNKLGMIRPTDSYVSYVAYERNDTGVQTAKADAQIIAWIKGLFK
ncbi:MAG: septum formation initiator family protein [Eubacteriaceae bacterium]|nr:septum formation initiator family protein [Eubacteriaceae bacterium]MBR5995076.1 septum formation initiator family protein [Eubacteriaceae bacterium]